MRSKICLITVNVVVRLSALSNGVAMTLSKLLGSLRLISLIVHISWHHIVNVEDYVELKGGVMLGFACLDLGLCIGHLRMNAIWQRCYCSNVHKLQWLRYHTWVSC